MIATTFMSALIGSAVLFLLPDKCAAFAKWIALISGGFGLAVSIVVFFAYDSSGSRDAFQFAIQKDWIPAAGISFHVAADGISVVLLLLTGIVSVAGTLFSWNVERNAQRFHALFLLIIAGAYGVFISIDLFLLLVFYELVILPKYLLIAGWGSTNRSYAAMKLSLYSILGSALVIIGIIAAFIASGTGSFDLMVLQQSEYSLAFQAWAFPVLFLGFAVLAGLWPFHTWAPTGHVAAPTAASMLLAGVVMKLGAYGALRVAMPLFPDGLEQWRMPFAVLAAVSILWGAGAAMVQRDLKFVVGYSSISHMGFVMLGILSVGVLGIAGGVMQMFSHGIIAGLLFAVVGRILYDRVHTRDLDALSKLQLGRAMPMAAGIFVVASAASMGLPGFSGFIAELMVLFGAWDSFAWLLVPVGAGIVFTAAFTLRALQQSFFTTDSNVAGPTDRSYAAITPAEIAGSALLILVALVVGLHPQPLIDLIVASFNSDLMRSILK